VAECKYGGTLGLPVFFCSFANGLSERYTELFEEGGVTSQHQANFGKKWRAYATIVELADGKLKEIDEVVKEPLEKCLLYLAYKADKVQLESMMHKEAMKSIGTK
jgi:DNA phosphorothioation-dependent restriction protein DptG